MLLFVAAAVATLFSCTHGENPAIQVTLTNKGLQYGKHRGADWVQSLLEIITLPDFSDKVFFGPVGTIFYTLTGTKVKKCDLPEPTVEFHPDLRGFKASLLGLSVALSGQWAARCAAFSSRGTFDMAVFTVNIISETKLGKDAGGHLSVTSLDCDAQVGDVDVRVRGGVSWIIQIILKHFKEYIRKKIESKICPYVEKVILNFDRHLQAMNVSFDVDRYLGMNESLTGLPLIDASSLTLGLKGEFYNIHTHSEPPFEAQSFTVPEQQRSMFSVGLSDFTVKSALYGYYTAGAFRALVNDSVLPPDFPVHLNTSAMGPYVPQLPKKFPGLLMNLHVYATEAPSFAFHPKAAHLGFQGAIDVYAVLTNGSQTLLFQLSIEWALSSTFLISDQKVKGSVSMDNLTLTLVESNVGNFTTDALEKLVKTEMERELAQVNKRLGEGLILPRLKHAKLVKSDLKQWEGFIALFSDAEIFWGGFFS